MAILTISQLNRYVAFRIKEDKAVQNILVRGEISNFNCNMRSGHCYFSLKDQECSVRAVMFRSYADRIRFAPKDGMHIIAAASASLYERDGNFQLYITDMQEDGVGQQSLALEKLKKKLSLMGVFDAASKRPVPAFPKKVGVVTSGTSAALRDIINVVSRRYPLCELHVFPAQVQGDEAPESVAHSIENADKFGCDVLIVGRGGGSAEDLGAFNTERVAMAVYNCSVPVISAVGHETDVSLTDGAADLRAPTPSAAAELAVPSVEELSEKLKRETRLMTRLLLNISEQYESRYQRLRERLAGSSPKQRQIISCRELDILTEKLNELIKLKINAAESSVQKEILRLDALSPLKILQRGYALVYKDKTLLRSAAEAEAGSELDIKLGSGDLHVKVLSRKEDTDDI